MPKTQEVSGFRSIISGADHPMQYPRFGGGFSFLTGFIAAWCASQVLPVGGVTIGVMDANQKAGGAGVVATLLGTSWRWP